MRCIQCKTESTFTMKAETKRRNTAACADAVAFAIPTVLSERAPFWCQHKPMEEPKVTKSLNLVI